MNGSACLKKLQRLRQKPGRQGRRVTNVEFTLLTVAYRFDGLNGFGDALQHRPCFGQEDAPRVRQPDGFGVVFEQGQLKFVF